MKTVLVALALTLPWTARAESVTPAISYQAQPYMGRSSEGMPPSRRSADERSALNAFEPDPQAPQDSRGLPDDNKKNGAAQRREKTSATPAAPSDTQPTR